MANELVPPGARPKKAAVTMLAENTYYNLGKTELIDGNFSPYPHGVYIYPAGCYVEFSVSERFVLWFHGASNYYTSGEAYMPSLDILKWNGTAFVDTGLNTVAGTAGFLGWHKATVALEEGRYRLSGNAFLCVEWYFESVYDDLNITIPSPNIEVPKNVDAVVNYSISAPEPSDVSLIIPMTKSTLGAGRMYLSEGIVVPEWLDITKMEVK